MYTKKDFVSDQDVRWCPGCGDYSILAAIQMIMPKIGKKIEDIVFIAGIGCSSRFPYYMNTYGLHTIHGRALAVATGLKVQNPNLSVWVITGDGDGLSIGGNHTIHALRRNLDINVILFNNRIYGLTKGQHSPTSELGKVAKATPFGSVDRPMDPAQIALGSRGTFFARTMDTDVKHMQDVFLRAEKHRGTSFVEVLQNCNIFNDKTHDSVVNRAVRDERTLRLAQGKPFLFGKEKNKGIVLNRNSNNNGPAPRTVVLGEDGVTLDDILVHDEKRPDALLATLLAHMEYPSFPVPMGVFRAVEEPIYEDLMEKQIKAAREKSPPAHGGSSSVQALVESGDTWKVN